MNNTFVSACTHKKWHPSGHRNQILSCLYIFLTYFKHIYSIKTLTAYSALPYCIWCVIEDLNSMYDNNFPAVYYFVHSLSIYAYITLIIVVLTCLQDCAVLPLYTFLLNTRCILNPLYLLPAQERALH